MKLLCDQHHFGSAFKAASEVGDIQFIEALVQLRGNVRLKDLGYALIYASRKGNDDVAKILIDSGADTNVAINDEGGPPLVEALKRYNKFLVLELLDNDANPNGSARDNPLQLALDWGEVSIINALIHAGADVNERLVSPYARAPITIAVERQDYKLVEILLEAEADVNDPEARKSCATALNATAKLGDLDIATRLLDYGADPQDIEALYAAAKLADRSLFDLILETHHKRYPKSYKGFGSEVLQVAVDKGDADLARRMLRRKASYDTFLNYNAFNRYVGDFCMSNQFPDLDTFRVSNTSPLGYAIFVEKSTANSFVDLFLQEGHCSPDAVVAQVRNLDSDDEQQLRITALLAAMGTRNASMVKKLIKHGANINLPARSVIKRTPLQRAAEIGDMEIVQLLLDHGAEVNAAAVQRQGGTAL